MRFFCYLFMILLISCPSGVFAEFYKYTDKNGVVNFTDDLSRVPEDQRPKMKSYTGSADHLSPATEPQPADEKAKAQSRTEEQEIRDAKFENIKKEREDIDGTRAALDKEYAELTQEKEALTQARDKVTKDTEAIAHNEKIRKLNERIDNYIKRRDAFDQRAKAFIEAGKK